MLIRMCWSRRYSGSEMIGVSCKDKLMWVSAIGGLQEHGSACASPTNEQTSSGQTTRVPCHPQDQPLPWCLGISGRRLHTFGVSPLLLPAQQTECTHTGLSCSFFLRWGLQIALGGSDQALIRVCSQKSVWLLLQSLIAVSFPSLSV